MGKIAQGQLTIIDLYDMPPIQARLSSNKAKIFIESKGGTIDPTLTETDYLLIDVEVYQAGSSINIAQNPDPNLGTIDSIEWTFVTDKKTYLWKEEADRNALKTLGVDVISPGGVANRQVKITKNGILIPTLKIQAIAKYKYTGISTPTNVGMDIDFATIHSGVDGEDAFTVLLSNTSHTFPIEPKTGSIIPGVSVETRAEVYQGISKISNVKIAIKPGFTDRRFLIDANGTTDTAKITTAGATRVYGTPETDQGTIPFVITVPGVSEPFEQSFSWTVSSKGVDGESATSYWLDISEAIIIKSFDSLGNPTITPSTITLKAMKQVGESAPTEWTRDAIIRVYKNGSTTPIVVSNGSYPVSSDTTSLKFEMLKGTILLDSETIRVVQQQREPVVMAVQADSDTIRNGEGTITLKAVVYKNGKDFTESAAKKWYKTGKVIDGQTASTLLVTSDMIDSSEIFKCEATVEGTIYSDSITTWDISDPMFIELRSSGGDKFQNGKGESILECIVWRNGVEIDVVGAEYEYTWKKLNINGTEVPFTPVQEPVGSGTNKKIKVTNTDVDKKATFVCEVYSK